MFASLPYRPGVLQQVLSENAMLLGLVGLHCAASLMLSQITGMSFNVGMMTDLWMLFGAMVPTYLILRFVYMLGVVRPARPISWLVQDLRRILTDPDRMIGGLLAFTAIILFQHSFGYMKEMIPLIHPFSWDLTFLAWDRALHFGTDPYLVLMPLITTPLTIGLLNFAYHFWFLIMLIIPFLACFDRSNPQARMTFLIAHVLTWGIGGNLMALALSSAGPVYLERLDISTVFVPLTAALQEASARVWLPALDVQELLWDGYTGNGPVAGISAMPSMHVGSTTLFTCYAFTWRRWAGWLMVGFWGLILVGSVALGWHYAVDGYLGAALALLFWHVAARAVQRSRDSEGAPSLGQRPKAPSFRP